MQLGLHRPFKNTMTLEDVVFEGALQRNLANAKTRVQILTPKAVLVATNSEVVRPAKHSLTMHHLILRKHMEHEHKHKLHIDSSFRKLTM